MTDAIEIIHRDHVNLDRFLNVLETVVDGLAPDQPKPNLELLYSAVYYTRVFPERCHHLKEERYLFGAVRVRCLEEWELIPAARNHLEPADWGAINRALGTDSDPLFGETMETGFRSLSEKITR